MKCYLLLGLLATLVGKISAASDDTLEITANGSDIKKFYDNKNLQIGSTEGENFGVFDTEANSFNCMYNYAQDPHCAIGPSKSIIDLNEAFEKDLLADFKILEHVVDDEGSDAYYQFGVNGIAVDPIAPDIKINYAIIDEYNDIYPTDLKKVGSYDVDGAEYTVYKYGQKKFLQYYAFRTDKRRSGTINVSAHLKAWEKLHLNEMLLDEIVVFATASAKESEEVKNITGKFKMNSKVYYEEQCPEKITKLGYDCCSSECKTVYTDKYGNWGIENKKWCGCNNEPEGRTNCSYKIISLGYKCCPENCEVITTDKYGSWGVHNGKFCGC